MNNTFDKINEWVRGTESSVVNFVSAVAPWLAPITPAYMTYDHAVNKLHFPEWVAFPAAAVVEILGFSAVSTLMSFWFFNRRNRAEAKKAPMGWVMFAFAFYLALIVCSNVLLDALKDNENAVIAVKALYTLQTIPAALIVIARVGHKDLLAEMAKEKKDKANEQANEGANRSQESEQDTNDSPKESERSATARTYDSLSQSDKYFVLNSLSKVIAKEYRVGVRAAQKWKVRVQEEVQQGKL